jgi:hypothetical protein
MNEPAYWKTNPLLLKHSFTVLLNDCTFKMSIAYITIYTKGHSVGGDPSTDYRIGVAAGAVGCGRRFTDKTMSRLTWMTIINGHLIYNGPLLSRLEENPWAAGGRKWHCYRVPHHHDLGPVDAVLASGVDKSVLPSSQNRFVVDSPAARALITYAAAAAAAAAP